MNFQSVKPIGETELILMHKFISTLTFFFLPLAWVEAEQWQSAMPHENPML